MNPAKFSSIDQYHDLASPEAKPLLDELRCTIRKAAPHAIETISYNMPAFRHQNAVLVYYAAAKSHIGFYPTASPIKVFEKELLKYKASKGAIQFPLNKSLPLSLIKKIVKFRLKENDEYQLSKKLKTGKSF